MGLCKRAKHKQSSCGHMSCGAPGRSREAAGQEAAACLLRSPGGPHTTCERRVELGRNTGLDWHAGVPAHELWDHHLLLAGGW